MRFGFFYGVTSWYFLLLLVYLFGVRPRLTAAARGSLLRRAPA